jgi:hypothetical protein
MMLGGFRTPFLHCNCTYKYRDIAHAYQELKWVGEQLKIKEIPEELSPMIFAVTGKGRTAKGVYEVLENLPITKINPNQLENIWTDRYNPEHRKTIYVLNINAEDCMEPLDHNTRFSRSDYYANPGKYTSNFATKYLPYISALFHCIYWELGFPMYIENKDLVELQQQKRLRLMGICDVTCDTDGAIECIK